MDPSAGPVARLEDERGETRFGQRPRSRKAGDTRSHDDHIRGGFGHFVAHARSA
jgi:hypothetical protein